VSTRSDNLVGGGDRGIFYYGEITGQRSITAFLGSAGVLLAGVVVLSAFGK